MPDLDIIERRLTRHWRRPYRIAAGDLMASDATGAAIERALAATLREAGGCPGLAELGTALWRVIQGHESDLPISVGTQSKIVRAAAEEALRLSRSEVIRAEGLSEAGVQQRLAIALVTRIVNSYLFAPTRDRLIHQRCGTYREQIEFERACLNAARIDRVAAQLLRKPDGAGFRAGPRRRQRLSTAEILTQVLG